jgi:hypothetical protein
VDPEEVNGAREILASLERTYRTLRLYTEDNTVCRQRVQELEELLNVHLEHWDPCELTVTETAMWLGDEAVYDAGERTDSLPFLLYRDGIRLLSLHHGVDRDQLHQFVAAVVTASRVAQDEDDLVTLLWERDLHHIRYLAIDELTDDDDLPRLETQLARRTLSQDGEPAAPPVTLADLSQPVTHLPVSGCQLDEHEIEALHRELVAEERSDHLETVADLAVELACIENDDDERARLVETLVQVVTRALTEAPLTRTISVLDHMGNLCARTQSSRTAHIARELAQTLSGAEALDLLLAKVESTPHLAPPSAVAAYLERLGTPALSELIPRIASLPHAEYRRAAGDALASAGAWGVAELHRYLASTTDIDATLVPEVLHVARNHDGAQVLPLIRAVLDQADPHRRLQAARALGPYRDGPFGEAWLSLLDDPNEEMRELALKALVHSRRPELAQPIAERTMLPHFIERSAAEKEAMLTALARLGGANALPWLQQLLEQPQGGWLASRQARETITAVARSIAAVGGESAQKTLAELARSGSNRTVRAACRSALKELQQ